MLNAFYPPIHYNYPMPPLSRRGFLNASLLASILLLVPKSGLQAYQTYYVSNSGSDHNSGSRLFPWKTIARVNAARLQPGDQVLFHCGETFPGRLIPRSSGGELDITYASYGSDDRPVIDGSASSALYIASSLYHHLIYDGLDFAGSTGEGMPTVRCYTHDVTFHNCLMRGSSRYNGFSAWSTSGEGIFNLLLDSCEAYGNYAQGIFIGSETGEDGPHDCLVVACSAHHNGHESYHDHGIYAKFGVELRGNACFNNPAGAGIKVNCEGVHTSPYSPIVQDNTAHDNKLGLYIVHRSAVCVNNLVYGNQLANVELDQDSQECTIAFNTLCNVDNGKDSRAINIAGTPTNNTLKNNLLIQDRSIASADLYQANGPSGIEQLAKDNLFDYNAVYTGGSSQTNIFRDDGGPLSWADWIALEGAPDRHSTFLADPPDVVNRYADLHPVNGGNLSGLGIVTGYNVDKDGQPRSSPPTPGCYE